MEQQKEYYAFISYKREDEKWAKWLQDKLEHYKFPTNLNGRNDLPKNIRPTFRDVTDLKPGLLAEEINNALVNSEWLIIVCSPRSAKSPWVCKEAQTFIDFGRSDHIIPFVVEGNPFSDDTSTECYPEALLNLTGSKELLAANINEMGRDAAAIKVVARMFNLRFDSLWQRYEREQKRKKWSWSVGSMLIALLGLAIGLYFVKQNRTIQNKNAQLKIERNNVIRANISLNLSLMKTYLSENIPEMALLVLDDIKPNVELLDSIQYIDLRSMTESLCDSILSGPVLLVNITDVEERKHIVDTTLFCNNENVAIQCVDDVDVLYIHSKENNKTDTIYGNPELNYTSNWSKSFIAAYVDGENEYITWDTLFTKEKAGIRIFSLQTGRLEHFIGCWGWFSWMTYPMSLSNDGMSLVYHEGYRAFERTWYVDFEKGQRYALQTSYTNTCGSAISSFSPNDNYFYLYDIEKKLIKIYSTHSLDMIHTFKYENVDTVYWDSSNDICISSGGKVYSWKISDSKKNLTFNVGSFAKAIDVSNKHAAVACDDGKIYILDILAGKIIFEKEIIDAPEDVAFTKDETQLWVVSGYNSVNTIDVKSKRIKSVYEEDDEYEPPHPWKAYLYMTKNGKYCISRCCYGDYYSLFDIKGNVIKSGAHFDKYIKEHPDDILSEFVMPEEFDYDSDLMDPQMPVLTARRLSSDGKVCIEGYSNGLIKVFYVKERNSIRTLIMGECGLNNSVEFRDNNNNKSWAFLPLYNQAFVKFTILRTLLEGNGCDKVFM